MVSNNAVAAVFAKREEFPKNQNMGQRSKLSDWEQGAERSLWEEEEEESILLKSQTDTLQQKY